MGLRKKKTLMDQAADIVEGIRPTIESAVETARDKAGPLLTEAARRQARCSPRRARRLGRC